MPDATAQPQLVSYLIGGAVIVVVMALRFRSASRERRLRLGSLWVLPAIFVAIAALTFRTAPPSLATLGACALALAVGAALGWQRGKMMHIQVDAQTQALTQKSSPAAMLFLAAIIALRFGARALMDSGVVPVHANPMAVSDVLLCFAIGMFGLMRAEMFLRGRRLLSEARGTMA